LKIGPLDFNEARDDGVALTSAGPYVNHTSLETDNHASTSSLKRPQWRI